MPRDRFVRLAETVVATAMTAEFGAENRTGEALPGETLGNSVDRGVVPASRQDEIPGPAATARAVNLEAGLYAVVIGEIANRYGEAAGVNVPAVQIAAPLSDDLDPVEIVAASTDFDSWLGPEGGTVIVRALPGGGRVLITLYTLPGEPPAPLDIDIRRLDRHQPVAVGKPAAEPTTRESPSVASGSREIRSELTVHIERVGDRRFPGQGWVGTRGQQLRIEAFGLKPLETLSASDVEYKACAPQGRETPWVSDGKLCGSRGQRLPLTGFAMRLAPHLRGRFDIIYQGAFFAGGVVGPNRNGEICASPVAEDPLEALNIRLIERIGR